LDETVTSGSDVAEESLVYRRVQTVAGYERFRFDSFGGVVTILGEEGVWRRRRARKGGRRNERE
jgi:hypothetical protein